MGLGIGPSREKLISMGIEKHTAHELLLAKIKSHIADGENGKGPEFDLLCELLSQAKIPHDEKAKVIQSLEKIRQEMEERAKTANYYAEQLTSVIGHIPND